jgi:hypothetical protein
MTSELWRVTARMGWLLIVCFALQSGALSARAQSEPDEYKQLIEQALSEFKRQNWPEARVLFRRAHEVAPNARTLRGMGVVSFEMRDYVQAVRDLSAALSDDRQPLTREQLTEAKNLLERSRTFVATFTVSVEPADAVVKIDGATPVVEKDGGVLLAFGPHVVTAERDGYENEQTKLEVEGGERGEIKLALRPLQPSAVAQDVPPSSVRPSAVSTPRNRAAERVTGGLKWTWVTLGATAAFGGAAGLMWMQGAKELDDLDRRCESDADGGMPCKRGSVDTNTIERYQLLTNVSLGLAGVALLGTAALAVVEWPRTEKRPLAWGAGPGSLSVRGAF